MENIQIEIPVADLQNNIEIEITNSIDFDFLQEKSLLKVPPLVKRVHDTH